MVKLDIGAKIRCVEVGTGSCLRQGFEYTIHALSASRDGYLIRCHFCCGPGDEPSEDHYVPFSLGGSRGGELFELGGGPW